MNHIARNAILGAAVGAAIGALKMAIQSKKGEVDEGVKERTHLCRDAALKEAVMKFSTLKKVNDEARKKYESLLDNSERLAKAMQDTRKNQVLTNRMAKDTLRDAEALCKIGAENAEWMHEAAAASIEIDGLRKICDNAVHNAVMSGV